MKKRLVIWVIFTVIIISITATVQAQQSADGYDYFVKALLQFPYPYKLSGDQHLGTLRGFDIPEDEDCGYIEMYIITRDNKLTDIKVVGDKIQLAIFMHELDPFTGKYKFWNPVILFPSTAKLPPLGIYSIWDVDIVGRFFIKRDPHSADPNKVLEYENEVYYR